VGERSLLAGGVAMPVIYFVTLIVAGVVQPHYSHATQAPSELGAPGAAYPWIYNAGMIVTALAGAAGAFGLALGLRLRAGTVLAVLTALTVLLPSVAFAMAGLFPLPNPLHYGFNLNLTGLGTTVLGAFSLRRAADDRRSAGILVAAFVVTLAVIAITFGVGGIATDANGGIWVRVLALLYLCSVAFLSWRVLKPRGERRT
jgi:hypothetical membrane protein